MSENNSELTNFLNDFHKKVFKKPRKSILEKEDELRKVTDLYVQENTKLQIAQKLGFTPSHTQKCINTIIDRWQQESIADIHKLKISQLRKLDKMEAELWVAWEESKKGTKRKLQAKSKRPRTDRNTGAVTYTESDRFELEENTTAGNMEYMRGILAIVSKRCEIAGLYAPKKFTETDITGEKEKEAFTRDEILSKIAGLVNNTPQNYIDAEPINEVDKLMLEPPKEDVEEVPQSEENLNVAEQDNSKLPWQNYTSSDDSPVNTSVEIGDAKPIQEFTDKGLKFMENQLNNIPKLPTMLRR
jgi:hypothetical protein